jgi:hypothetical protein
MKQSNAWVMATLGVLALSACGTQSIPTITSETKTIDGNTNGGGNGDSRIPTGPAGDLTRNVDFRLSKADGKLLRGILEGISSGKGPAGILGNIVGLGRALSPELNNGTQKCDSGTYTSNSTGGDADRDNIPVTALVTFSDCKFSFEVDNAPVTVKLNGTLELEDHNPDANDNSFLFVAKLQASGTGNLNVGGTIINLNTSANLHIGLDIIKKSGNYDVDFGLKLGIDGKTVAARLDASIVPNGSRGTIDLAGKVGFSEPGGSDTVVGFSSAGLSYDSDCVDLIDKATLTITDGRPERALVITKTRCGGIVEAKVGGQFVDW